MHKGEEPRLGSFWLQFKILVQEISKEELGFNDNTMTNLVCMRAWGMGVKIRPNATTILLRWTPLPMGFVKINTDGSEVNGVIQGGGV